MKIAYYRFKPLTSQNRSWPLFYALSSIYPHRPKKLARPVL